MEAFVWTYIRIIGNDDCTRLKERVSSFRHLIGWWAYLKYVRVTYYISTLEGLMWEVRRKCPPVNPANRCHLQREVPMSRDLAILDSAGTSELFTITTPASCPFTHLTFR